MGLWRHLVTTGAWDVVDEIADHLVGSVLARHRIGLTPTLRPVTRRLSQLSRREALKRLGP